MVPRLTIIEKIKGWFLWKCMDFLNLQLEDIDRTTLYKTNPGKRYLLWDYFYYRQSKEWKE